VYVILLDFCYEDGRVGLIAYCSCVIIVVQWFADVLMIRRLVARPTTLDGVGTQTHAPVRTLCMAVVEGMPTIL